MASTAAISGPTEPPLCVVPVWGEPARNVPHGSKRISTSFLKAILIDTAASGANRAAAWLQSKIGGCGLSELGDPFFADGFDQIAKLDDRGELERQIVGVHIVLV